jgi:hypothetical protein
MEELDVRSFHEIDLIVIDYICAPDWRLDYLHL